MNYVQFMRMCPVVKWTGVLVQIGSIVVPVNAWALRRPGVGYRICI